MSGGPQVVTFDLFSALIDSRTGGSTALDDLARRHGWATTGHLLYDAWDPRNKAAQRDCPVWEPWRAPAARAMAAAYAALEVDDDPAEGVEALVASMPDWPLWPDVTAGLPAVADVKRVGVLSNVDDELFASTAAAPLVDTELALTSERLGVYKPHAAIYQRAVDGWGPLVHVASSARDVRGALESGIAVVRLERPGHALDPEGPTPDLEVTSTAELPGLLAGLA